MLNTWVCYNATDFFNQYMIAYMIIYICDYINIYMIVYRYDYIYIGLYVYMIIYILYDYIYIYMIIYIYDYIMYDYKYDYIYDYVYIYILWLYVNLWSNVNSIFLLIKSQQVLVDVYNPSFCDAFPMFCLKSLSFVVWIAWNHMFGLLNPVGFFNGLYPRGAM